MRAGPTPAFRHPQPIFAGNIRNSGSGASSKQTFGLTPGPVVGTAWQLLGFVLTIVGPDAAVSEDINLDLLLNGEVIDSFAPGAGISAVAGLPLVIAHDYTNPYIVYDSSSLQLRQNYQETPAAVGYLDYRYSGKVAYLD